jgi:hypothetical protein
MLNQVKAMPKTIVSSSALLLALGLSLSCEQHGGERSKGQQTESQALAATPKTAGAAFRHLRSASRFNVGKDAREVREAGFTKTVGSEGVFATHDTTGAVYSVPNATASAARARPLSDPKAHTEQVLAYFKGSGVPQDEIGGTHITTAMAAEGTAGEAPHQVKPRLVGYYTHLDRVIDGIPVVGSMAWARLSDAGEVVEESVYWPAISSNTVAGARALAAIAADPAKEASLRSAITRNAPDAAGLKGRVIIKHTPGHESPEFVEAAVYDVEITNIGGKGATVHKSFDIVGKQVRLPHERRAAPAEDVKTE